MDEESLLFTKSCINEHQRKVTIPGNDLRNLLDCFGIIKYRKILCDASVLSFPFELILDNVTCMFDNDLFKIAVREDVPIWHLGISFDLVNDRQPLMSLWRLTKDMRSTYITSFAIKNMDLTCEGDFLARMLVSNHSITALKIADCVMTTKQTKCLFNAIAGNMHILSLTYINDYRQEDDQSILRMLAKTTSLQEFSFVYHDAPESFWIAFRIVAEKYLLKLNCFLYRFLLNSSLIIPNLEHHYIMWKWQYFVNAKMTVHDCETLSHKKRKQFTGTDILDMQKMISDEDATEDLILHCISFPEGLLPVLLLSKFKKLKSLRITNCMLSKFK